MKYYNVISHGDYSITYEQHPTPLEKLSNTFVTDEELDAHYGWRQGIWGAGVQNLVKSFHQEKIKKALMDWSMLIKPGNTCSTIHTAEISSLLYEARNNYVLSNLCPAGHTVHGDRIINEHQVKINKKNRMRIAKEHRESIRRALENGPYIRPDKVMIGDKSTLITYIERAIYIKYNIRVEFYTWKEKTAKGIKKLCTWDEVRRLIRKELKFKRYRVDIKYIKDAWDNPDLCK